MYSTNEPRRSEAIAAWHASLLAFQLAMRGRNYSRCPAVLYCYQTQLLSLPQVSSRRSTQSLISSHRSFKGLQELRIEAGE